jgi:deazaflavin-dependent oxidoreductase (nitroreductase family)
MMLKRDSLFANFNKFEQKAFRSLNSVVEPAVRRGIGSPTLVPAGLIVLETTGFKSGAQRRTPLWSFQLGRYRIVSTARGKRSFWVKNLLQQPKVSYYLGGRRRESHAIVIAEGAPQHSAAALTPLMRKVTEVFARYARSGWAFAILVPVKR